MGFTNNRNENRFFCFSDPGPHCQHLGIWASIEQVHWLAGYIFSYVQVHTSRSNSNQQREVGGLTLSQVGPHRATWASARRPANSSKCTGKVSAQLGNKIVTERVQLRVKTSAPFTRPSEAGCKKELWGICLLSCSCLPMLPQELFETWHYNDSKASTWL